MGEGRGLSPEAWQEDPPVLVTRTGRSHPESGEPEGLEWQLTPDQADELVGWLGWYEEAVAQGASGVEIDMDDMRAGRTLFYLTRTERARPPVARWEDDAWALAAVPSGTGEQLAIAELTLGANGYVIALLDEGRPAGPGPTGIDMPFAAIATLMLASVRDAYREELAAVLASLPGQVDRELVAAVERGLADGAEGRLVSGEVDWGRARTVLRPLLEAGSAEVRERAVTLLGRTGERGDGPAVREARRGR